MKIDDALKESKARRKLAEEENPNTKSEDSLLSQLQDIIDSGRKLVVGNQMIDVFGAAMILIIAAALPPNKRKIFLALPIRELLIFASKNAKKIVAAVKKKNPTI